MGEKPLGKREVGLLLAVTGVLVCGMWLTWDASQAGTTVDDAPDAGVAVVNGFVFSVNGDGETYGTTQQTVGDDGMIINVEPDWQECEASNGAVGYCRTEDLQVPMAANPGEAAGEKFFGTHVKKAPVYDEPDAESEVVGYFKMYYGSGPQGVDAGSE